MPLVLAIEPDLRQAAIVKRIVREKVQAEVAVVDSRDAALEAMRTTMPDVLLLSALMSPRDEDELIAHLRTLEAADHLQTHTIPQLASTLGPGEEAAPRGLLSAFRRRKSQGAAPTGCDPDIFAEEIRSYLQRAADKKRERVDAAAGDGTADHSWRAAKPQIEVAAEPAPSEPAAGSSWASPFEWKPSNPSPRIADAELPVPDPEPILAAPEALIPEPERLMPDPEPLIAAPEPLIVKPEPLIAAPERVAAESAAAPVAELLMAHLRPPAGIPKVEEVIAPSIEPPAPAAVTIEASAMPAPRLEPPMPSSPIRDSLSAESRIPESRTPESRIRGSRSAASRIGDAGFAIKDSRSVIRDKRLGVWARSESPARGGAKGSDDLRGLLSALAVPAAVVAVGYGRGCRIRRVRVPAAREPHDEKSTDGVGAVILSRRLLAEERDRREPLRP